MAHLACFRPHGALGPGSRPRQAAETAGVNGEVALGGPCPPPSPRHCPAWRSPRLGGSGWAASAPAGRTAPRAWPPWGTGAQAASGSPGHAPAESDTGGPRGEASRVSPHRVRSPPTSVTWTLASRSSVGDTCCLLFWLNILSFLSGTSPYHHMHVHGDMTQPRITGTVHSLGHSDWPKTST